MLAPLAALMATDYIITVYMVHYAFHWQDYATTWAWYLMAMVLGQILLKAKTSALRVGAGSLLGPTSFFVVSNYAVWASSGMYPHDASGLLTCYNMGLPFYRNDVVSTALVAGLAFGLPVLVRRMNWVRTEAVATAK
jgi:DMSO reductase anchor subunit